MAVTKTSDMGLIKILKKAMKVAKVHPDADVNTTAHTAIQAVITNLIAAGVIDQTAGPAY